MVRKVKITREERDEVLELQRQASMSMHLLKNAGSCMEYAQKELVERWITSQGEVELKVFELMEKYGCMNLVGEDEYVAKGWVINFSDQALYAVTRKLEDDLPWLTSQG